MTVSYTICMGNSMVFRVQFGYNMHVLVFQRRRSKMFVKKTIFFISCTCEIEIVVILHKHMAR
jgi:hypothetical protein